MVVLDNFPVGSQGDFGTDILHLGYKNMFAQSSNFASKKWKHAVHLKWVKDHNDGVWEENNSDGVTSK